MTGVLLAGGHGLRMGRDKATLTFEGETLARRVAGRLGEICAEVVVASGDGARLGWLGLPQAVDPVTDAGPLAGVVAGLRAASHDLVAVVAVDMPHASPAVLGLLAALHAGEDAVVPWTDRGPEPLHAVYARAAGEVLAAALHRGTRRMQEALEALTVRCVGPEEWRVADPSGRFADNLNRPADLP